MGPSSTARGELVGQTTRLMLGTQIPQQTHFQQFYPNPTLSARGTGHPPAAAAHDVYSEAYHIPSSASAVRQPPGSA